MKNRSIDDVEIISIPKIIDEEGRGKLSVIEKSINGKSKSLWIIFINAPIITIAAPIP